MRPRFERRGDCVERATIKRGVVVVDVWHIGVARRRSMVLHLGLTTKLYGQLVRRRDFQIKETLFTGTRKGNTTTTHLRDEHVPRFADVVLVDVPTKRV